METGIAGRGEKSQAVALLACALLMPLLAAAPQKDEATPRARAVRYEMDVRFEPDRSFLRARASVALCAAAPVATLEFELNPSLRILSVADAAGRALDFERSRRIGSPHLLVRLAEPAAEAKITFVYEGVLLRGELDYITRDAILLRDESRWYPVADLAAFAENDIRIRVPARLAAVASGELVESLTEGETRIFVWRTSRPVSSRAIAASPARLWEAGASAAPREGAGAPAVEALCGAGDAGCRALEERARGIVAHFAHRLGAFPPGRMTLFPGFPGARGALGYSAPGFLVVSEDFVKWRDAPGYAPEFLPHELAHQWFPVEVAPARAEDGWLAESLAEYLAWRYLLEKEPAAGRAMVARAMRDAVAQAPQRPLRLGLRLFALEERDALHALLYQRGLLVWRTLETVIGRSRVDAALRALFERFRGRSASVEDFQKVCEEIAGRDLGWFFAYFLDGVETPEVELRRVPAAAPNELAGEIVVRNVPAEFTVRVEMRIQTAAGPVDHSVATRGEATPFSVTLPAPAGGVALDPDARVLRWTDAARRHRAQQPLLAEVGLLERAHQFTRALGVLEQALQLDPEDLAGNHQGIYFQTGRLRHRRGEFQRAWEAFERALALESLDAMATDFFRAWARVYRARAAFRLGRLMAARAEAQLGLAMKSPALETPVAWPESSERATTAREALERLAR
jgi:tetratricopeptide (TPR) repeat protein